MAEEEARQSDLKRRRVDVASDRNRLLLLNVDELRKAEIRDSEIQTKVYFIRTNYARLSRSCSTVRNKNRCGIKYVVFLRPAGGLG